nr:FixH family protein [Mesorhizobium tianshanense]
MLGVNGFCARCVFSTARRDAICLARRYPEEGTGLASLWRYVLAGLGLAALLTGVLAAVYLTAPHAPQRAGSEIVRSKKTANGLFVASFEPERGDVRQGELQSWLLTLKTDAGVPVEAAAITISGGMPQHRHGLPTSPQATDYLGDGCYRIDGVKFTMSGLWQLHFAISAAAGSDTVVFDVLL